MKIETQYVCEICGAVYSDKGDCEACERAHFANLKVIPWKHYNPHERWPQFIEVQCEETGERATYEVRYPTIL